MDPAVAEYLAAIGMNPTAASPTVPAPPGAPTAQGAPGGWQSALQNGLLALGGFLSARNGNLGTFTGSYLSAEAARQRQADQQRRLEMDQQELGMRQQQMAQVAADRQAQMDLRQQQEQARAEAAAAKQAEAEAKAEEARKAVETRQIQKSLDAAAQNPTLNALISAFGADAFTVKTPLGPMSIAEAQKRGAIVSGKLGTPDLPKKERAPLVTTPGPDGSPVRTEDKPGVRVYQRPRATKEPKAPAAPRTTRYTWKDDDPASPTYGQSFRVIEDEAGNVVKKERLTGAPVAPAAPAGSPNKIGRFTVEVEN